VRADENIPCAVQLELSVGINRFAGDTSDLVPMTENYKSFEDFVSRSTGWAGYGRNLCREMPAFVFARVWIFEGRRLISCPLDVTLTAGR
jgi:hypothetical protein